VSSLGVVIRKVRAALELSPAEPVQLTPVVIAEDLTEPQNNSQFDERLSIGRIPRAAEALELSHIQLFNPGGSGVLVVLDQILADASAQDLCDVVPFDTPLTTEGTAKAFRDSRISGAPVAQLREQTNLTLLGTAIYTFTVPAAESFLLNLVWILEPGTGIHIALHTVNVALEGGFKWNELALPNV